MCCLEKWKNSCFLTLYYDNFNNNFLKNQTLTGQLSEVSVKRSEVEAKMDAEHGETKAILNQLLIKTAQQDDQMHERLGMV